jgi:hypothetical protein
VQNIRSHGLSVCFLGVLKSALKWGLIVTVTRGVRHGIQKSLHVTQSHVAYHAALIEPVEHTKKFSYWICHVDSRVHKVWH